MIGDTALSIGATKSRTGIPTLLADTSRLLRTFRAHQAFGSAVGRRSDLVGLAGADTHTVLLLLLAVRSAGIRVARVQLFNDWDPGGQE